MTVRAPKLTTLASLFLVLVLPGCVKKSTYRSTLDALAQSRADREDLEARTEAARRQWEATRDSLEARVAELQADSTDLDRHGAEMTSRFEEARDEVHRLETLLDERGSEYRRLQQRLDQLAAVEREVRERNRIYQEVLGKFQSLIDAGQLSVSISRGRMVINLPQDILFESGSATVGREGRETIAQVAQVLADLPDRSFQVEGHTDNVPISTARFPSNWELSTARALSVVQLLVRGGVPPENLSGAGYGEYQPVASNDDAAGRRRNRRIEIVMLPNLDLIAGESIGG
jgi:chemotaxis protein MotB